MLRLKSSVTFVVDTSWVVTVDASVVEIETSGRKVVVVVVVVNTAEVVVTSGGTSGNLEVDVATADWPVVP
jgi:hypothetical protein